MRRKPLLFIDIDGVISVWGFAESRRPDGIWTLVDGLPHFLSSTAGITLAALGETYDCVWCSGWEEKANEYLPRLLGLGPWPFLRLDRPTSPGTSVHAHWKLDAVEAYADGRPLAWIDDAVDDGVRAWVRTRDPAALLIETAPAEGLTPAQGQRLRAWAAQRG